MKRKIGRKVLVNWGASLLAIGLLLAIVATPVVASVTSGWVTSADIKDGTIMTRDVKRDAITSSRIKDYSITKEDIHSGSINKYKLITGAVTSAKIADGAVGTADIADGSITNTDIADGANISDEKISYSTKPKAFSIVGAAFRPEDSPDPFDIVNGNGSIYATGGLAYAYFFAPVHLPDGASVTLLRLNATDDFASYDARARLYRRDLSNSVTMMAETTTSGSSLSWQNPTDNSITVPTIDNFNYQYFVRVRVWADMHIGGATVTYTVAAP